MLPKRTHPWEFKANEETNLYVHANESIETDVNSILIRRWENHLLSYDVLILEVSFHDVWVEWNGTLGIDRLAMSGDHMIYLG